MRNTTKGIWWIWSLILLQACESKTLVRAEDKFFRTDSIGVSLELEKLKNDTSFGEARVYNFEARIQNNSLKPIYVLRPIGARFYPESSHVFVEQFYKNGHGIGCFGEPNSIDGTKLLPGEVQGGYVHIFLRDTNEILRVGMTYSENPIYIEKHPTQYLDATVLRTISFQIHKPDSIFINYNGSLVDF